MIAAAAAAAQPEGGRTGSPRDKAVCTTRTGTHPSGFASLGEAP